MRSLIFIFLIFLLGSASALTGFEVTALNSILGAFPSLRNVHPMDQFQYSNGVEDNWGGSWSEVTGTSCDGGGWRLHGIQCGSTGNVIGIRFSEGWGNYSGSLLDITDLLALESFSSSANLGAVSSPHVPSMSVMLEAVLALPGVIRLETDWPLRPSDFPQAAFTASSLKYVKLRFKPNAPKPSFDGLSALINVDLNWVPPFSNFTSSYSFLKELAFDSPAYIDNDFSAFTSLTSLTYEADLDTAVDSLIIPISLHSLRLLGWTGGNLTIGDEFSQLQELVLEQMRNPVSIDFLPLTIYSLTVLYADRITSWPHSEFCSLSTLHMERTGNVPLPVKLDNCSDLVVFHLGDASLPVYDSLLGLNMSSTVLRTVSIRGMNNWPSESNKPQADAFLCSLPSSLISLSLTNTWFAPFPSCVSQFTELKELDLTDVAFSRAPEQNFLVNFQSSVQKLLINADGLGLSITDSTAWAWLASNFQTLKFLQVLPVTPLHQPFPSGSLLQLDQLQELYLADFYFTGSIPSNFFADLPLLAVLDLDNNLLAGAIPSDGWDHLRYVSLAGNPLTSWDEVKAPGARLLEKLHLQSTNLQTLPSDANFLLMRSLRELYLHVAPDMTAPIPKFWTSQQSSLVKFVASFTHLHGTLPTEMQSPHLRELYISSIYICGELPEVTAPMGFTNLRYQAPRCTAPSLPLGALTFELHSV
jgi:hypothetical protein